MKIKAILKRIPGVSNLVRTLRLRRRFRILRNHGRRVWHRLLASFRKWQRKWQRAFLLKELGQGSICAEIGVYKGDFSSQILRVVKPKQLHLIDAWTIEDEETYDNAGYGRISGESQATMDKLYEHVNERFRSEIQQGQVVVHRAYSHDVSDNFADNYFDWIYIDANHLYEFVKRDLELYYPKVKVNGYITGDDYTEGGWWQGGVKKAVDEFVASRNLRLVQIKNQQFILRKEA